MTAIVWLISLGGLLLWSLLAWIANALVDGSAAGLAALLERASWEINVGPALGMAEGAGQAAVWLVWGLGSTGLLLCASYATLLLRRGRLAAS